MLVSKLEKNVAVESCRLLQMMIDYIKYFNRNVKVSSETLLIQTITTIML